MWLHVHVHVPPPKARHIQSLQYLKQEIKIYVPKIHPTFIWLVFTGIAILRDSKVLNSIKMFPSANPATHHM